MQYAVFGVGGAMVGCERCGALPPNGDGYCHVCGTPLARGLVRRGRLPAAPAITGRSRWLTRLILASVAVLVLLCLGLVVAGFGLTAFIRWP